MRKMTDIFNPDKKDYLALKHSFYATDELFACYDTYKVVEAFQKAEASPGGSSEAPWRSSYARRSEATVAPTPTK